MPARETGTEPVSECDAGVPAKPDADADQQRSASPICQYGLSSFHSSSIARKPSRQKT